MKTNFPLILGIAGVALLALGFIQLYTGQTAGAGMDLHRNLTIAALIAGEGLVGFALFLLNRPVRG